MYSILNSVFYLVKGATDFACWALKKRRPVDRKTMQFPLSWLLEYVNPQLSPQEIGRILTAAGIEVDSIEPVFLTASGESVPGEKGEHAGPLHADTIFEVSLTPNLGHCASILGIARELAAATNKPLKEPLITLKETAWDPIDSAVTVTVENPKDCPRYACRVIKDVVIGPSPEWLQRRLISCGLRPVNNVVDVTQYMVMERGLPLHAFDYEKVKDHRVIVRGAHPEECFITLDGRERILEGGDLLICDSQRPIALAGIMGGENSEVGETTTHVLLEGAYFRPGAIRKTSKRLALSTDASKRFERGCDPNDLHRALDRAAMLICELAEGRACAGTIDVFAAEFEEKKIPCSFNRLQSLLGIQISVNEVEGVFSRLGIRSVWDGRDTFTVSVPTYRADVSQEVDLIEEVARIYGYDNIQKVTPSYEASSIDHAPMYLFERSVRNLLVGEGLQEFITCDLIGPHILTIVRDPLMSPESVIKVLNPTSIEQSILRTSLLPGLLQVLKHNIDHETPTVHGFEIGRVHYKEQQTYKEQSVFGIILTGKRAPYHWDEKTEEADFYDLKGIVENVLNELSIPLVEFKKTNFPTFHSGRQAAIYMDQLELGSMGEVHPAILRRLDVNQRILFAELSLQDLMQVRKQEQKMEEIAKYPCSERDWTLSVSEDLPLQDLLKIVETISSPLLEKAFLLDLYRSESLGKDIKNVTLRFIYRDRTKTIEQEIVEKEHARILQEVQQVLRV